MTQSDDYYAILQVVPTAEPEVIRAAYRALAQKYHPDRGGPPARMIELNRAWASLRDPAARVSYDRQRSMAEGHAQARAEAPTVIVTPPPGSTRHGGTVLDFGRYAGRALGELAREDPDYLRWLERTPGGRAYRAEIDALLADPPPAPPPAHHAPGRTIFGRRPVAARWGEARAKS